MAGDISVSPEQLLTISARLEAGASEVDSVLSQLAALAAPLQTDWVGAGQVQFQELWAQWQHDAKGLLEALSGIAEIAARAATAYEATEQQIISTFHQG
jgi:WXG100 family type VII secretion target